MLTCAITCLLATSSILTNNLQADELRIIHINIGQGDATLIIGPESTSGERTNILVDAGNITIGGGKDGGAIVGAVLNKNGITELDWLIVSHYDADHIGGVVTGRQSVHGRSFILGPNGEPGNPGDDDNDGLNGWVNPALKVNPDPQELAASGTDDLPVIHFVDRGSAGAPSSRTHAKYVGMADAMVAALAGQGAARVSIENQADVDAFQITLGSGASMACLAANGFVRGRSTRVANVNTENERSLCFILRYGGFDYLIGGDTIGRTFGSENAEVEKAIGEFLASQNVNVDVLHVNHHGGNNASSTGFLAAVSPEIAVISLGNGNAHHHPNKEVLERLVDAGVYRIYQTEWGTTRDPIPATIRRRQAIFQGDVILTTDGTSYTISTSRSFDADN